MRRLFFIISTLLIIAVVVNAQTVTVESFVCSPTDLSAATNPVLDKNGVPCALVKIWCMDEIERIEGNTIGNIKTSGREHWVYLTKGSKEMRIIFKSSFPLHITFADYGITSLDSKETYILTTVNPTIGTINGHEWIDLGLSVKCATCNVGASSPSDYGNYYAWGETKTKSFYTEGNSITNSRKIGNIAGDSQYDAARANWGGTWRLPTKIEIEELMNVCNYMPTVIGGHNGYNVIGPNGNSIFLPAAGIYGEEADGNGGTVYGLGELGYYWSATPNEDSTSNSWGLYFGYEYFDSFWNFRGDGRSVRAVTE